MRKSNGAWRERQMGGGYGKKVKWGGGRYGEKLKCGGGVWQESQMGCGEKVKWGGGGMARKSNVEGYGEKGHREEFSSMLSYRRFEAH